jgi:putative membrane protein
VLREIPWTFLRGFCMGAADVVPGVSGGTIALLLGIYGRLVASVRAGSSALGHLTRLGGTDTRAWLRRVEWLFVLPLAFGIVTAIFVLAGVIEGLLDRRPVEMAAVFSGLVAASVVVAWGMVRSRDTRRVVIMVLTAGATFVVLGLGGEESAAVADPNLWFLYASGALAACAMILPGISGSFVLVLLGVYAPVLAAVDDRDLVVVGVVAAGAITGLALFSQVLDRALHRHHDSMVAALTGLMLGSFRVLWPWPDGLESTALGAPDEAVGLSLVLGGIAFALVLVLARVSRQTEAGI